MNDKIYVYLSSLTGNTEKLAMKRESGVMRSHKSIPIKSILSGLGRFWRKKSWN